MRMLPPKINFHSLYHTLTELVLREHTEYRLPQNPVRIGRKYFLGGNFPQPSRIQRVMAVHLAVQLQAGQLHLIGVQDDNVVSAYKEGSILGTVLSQKYGSRSCCNASKYLIGRVD